MGEDRKSVSAILGPGLLTILDQSVITLVPFILVLFCLYLFFANGSDLFADVVEKVIQVSSIIVLDRLALLHWIIL